VLTFLSPPSLSQQDTVIEDMHESDNSLRVWARIGTALGRKPASVKDRYFLLAARKTSLSGTTTATTTIGAAKSA